MSGDKTDAAISDWCSGQCFQPRGHQSACDPPAEEVRPAVVEIDVADLRAVYGHKCDSPTCPVCCEVRG